MKKPVSVQVKVIDEPPRLEQFFDALFALLVRLDDEDQQQTAPARHQPAA